MYDGWSGNATSIISNDIGSTFDLEVWPPTGKPLETEFIMSATSQIVEESVNKFAFGYMMNGMKHPITRLQTSTMAKVRLPDTQGMPITLYLEVHMENGVVYTVTEEVSMLVTAWTVTDFLSDFEARSTNTFSDAAYLSYGLTKYAGASVSQIADGILTGLGHDSIYMDQPSKGIALSSIN